MMTYLIGAEGNFLTKCVVTVEPLRQLLRLHHVKLVGWGSRKQELYWDITVTVKQPTKGEVHFTTDGVPITVERNLEDRSMYGPLSNFALYIVGVESEPGAAIEVHWELPNNTKVTKLEASRIEHYTPGELIRGLT